MALAIFERFIEIADTIEAADGEMIPYDPFPKGDYWAMDSIPVVAIDGFKVIQQELGTILKLKREKVKSQNRKASSVRRK